MIKQIIDSTKEELDAQFRKRGLSPAQSKEVIALAKETIHGKLINQLNDAEGLVNLLRSQTVEKSNMVKSMTTEFASKISGKMGGHYELMADGAANYAIPLIIGKVSNHISANGLDGISFSRQLQGGLGNPFKSFSKKILGKFSK
jgi:hypothetical protein